jgi:hypothetical protein
MAVVAIVAAAEVVQREGGRMGMQTTMRERGEDRRSDAPRVLGSTGGNLR